MPQRLLHLAALRGLTPDGRLLFLTRCVRLFAYGFLSVELMLYLESLHFGGAAAGSLFSLTMIGDIAVSLWLTTHADRIGRRKTLIVGALLMVLAGGVFAVSSNFMVLLIAATVGVISPSGDEIGPFLPVEQAALSQILPSEQRTEVFAWYNLVGSFATSFGALCGGGLTQLLADRGATGPDQYRPVVIGYAALGIVLAVIFTWLGPAAEVAKPDPSAPTPAAAKRFSFGLHRSRRIVFKLSCLFGLDAFAGGFVLQAIVAAWFVLRFGVEPAILGAIFCGANLLAGISALAAAAVARRIGLIRTMIYTHLPSNVLLILVPLMPDLPSAIAVLFLRFSISQMDVPTRQAYTMAVVAPDERSAAAGVTGVARSVGRSLSPALAGWMLTVPHSDTSASHPAAAATLWLSLPFFLAGGLKILYDLLLYRMFVSGKSGAENPGT